MNEVDKDEELVEMCREDFLAGNFSIYFYRNLLDKGQLTMAEYFAITKSNN